MRVRNSAALEVVLLVLVYTLGLWIWRNQLALEATTWKARPGGGLLHLTPAGYWYIFVSIPIFQFILLRWYLRLFLWFGFLWRVSRLDLNLIPTHPDRAGGLGFLGPGTYAYGPILLAQGVLLSGRIAGRIFEQGANLLDFKVQIVPFGLRDAARLAAVTAAPLAPLVLTIFSLDDLVTQLLKAIF